MKLPHMILAQPAKPLKQFTLILVTDTPHRRVLLGMKKRGFGAGRWNGFGGKLEPGESLPNAAARELQEECGLLVADPSRDLVRAGTLWFDFAADGAPDAPSSIFHVAVYQVEWDAGRFAGQPGEPPFETDEMRPAWFAFEEVPFDEMWADDPLWFPWLLKGDKFSLEAWFSGDTSTVLRTEGGSGEGDGAEVDGYVAERVAAQMCEVAAE
ncbi:hypothetical protein H9P43_006656 [Blastocladiella emersonii ATCC 22665]|nr:hypothetical protein H9P43_006656 [Blastocladiella emersonii ATCC 22665]